MKPITIAKYTVAGCGILVFGIGIRYNIESLRWVAIGLVAVAWMLRFAKGRPPE